MGDEPLYLPLKTIIDRLRRQHHSGWRARRGARRLKSQHELLHQAADALEALSRGEEWPGGVLEEIGAQR